ncbi:MULTISPECIES: YezD family protein [unclassified Paenibacillus]|uniref:YezD family protein n=1 Tax=unclassified Paenibacillus TaxID=185978 RepID=UPI001C115AB6|nr:MULTISPECIES: YezD family protein [unclassified Paenibacillus]MBU5444587.1 YezD family protein [Paenibacillus sp. MSJ-34]
MSKPLQIDDLWAERILASVRGLEYGNVQIVVHDGKIVQIERTERKRFDSEYPPLAGAGKQKGEDKKGKDRK